MSRFDKYSIRMYVECRIFSKWFKTFFLILLPLLKEIFSFQKSRLKLL